MGTFVKNHVYAVNRSPLSRRYAAGLKPVVGHETCLISHNEHVDVNAGRGR
jgi:hypothetical protein